MVLTDRCPKGKEAKYIAKRHASSDELNEKLFSSLIVDRMGESCLFADCGTGFDNLHGEFGVESMEVCEL